MHSQSAIPGRGSPTSGAVRKRQRPASLTKNPTRCRGKLRRQNHQGRDAHSPLGETRRVCALLVALLVLVVALPAPARTSVPDSSDDPLVVELLSMGPGDHPFYKFGHNALRIHNLRTGSDRVFNYGTFSFHSPTLLQDFFKGRLQYWLSEQRMDVTLLQYGDENRTLVAQRLALSARAKRSLLAQLEENLLPENRAYKYDYFFDNCSTRIRDAMDRATEGQLRESMRAPERWTLREHALRVTADYLPEYLVLMLGLGPLVDRPVDRWIEAFLPEVLTDAVRQASLKGGSGIAWPLVQSETELLKADRAAPRTHPPRWMLWFLATGAVAGALWVGQAELARRFRAAAAALGVVLSLFGLLVGLLGCALVALWLSTDHFIAYRNQNILLASPLALILPWYAVPLIWRGHSELGRLRYLALLLSGSAIVAAVLKILPVEWQDNGSLMAFFLPCWLGLLIGVWVTPETRDRWRLAVRRKTEARPADSNAPSAERTTRKV